MGGGTCDLLLAGVLLWRFSHCAFGFAVEPGALRYFSQILVMRGAMKLGLREAQ